jgi:hypothetical protein
MSYDTTHVENSVETVVDPTVPSTVSVSQELMWFMSYATTSLQTVSKPIIETVVETVHNLSKPLNCGKKTSRVVDFYCLRQQPMRKTVSKRIMFMETAHENGTWNIVSVSSSWSSAVFIISVPLFHRLTILNFRQVWLSRMIPLVPHGRENWPVAVSFLFSGRAQQLDCCRVSYDSRVRWWRGCWVTCRDCFTFGLWPTFRCCTTS